MILFSAGMGAKYLISVLHKLYPKAIYIDIGSAFDTICTGIVTRKCYSSYTDLVNYLSPIMPLPSLGKTYSWDNRGFITFDKLPVITTTWGRGSYSWIDTYTIKASWNGYTHIMIFNYYYTEHATTRIGDLDYTKGHLVEI
jgi:hypothetical protein